MWPDPNDPLYQEEQRGIGCNPVYMVGSLPLETAMAMAGISNAYVSSLTKRQILFRLSRSAWGLEIAGQGKKIWIEWITPKRLCIVVIMDIAVYKIMKILQRKQRRKRKAAGG